MESEYDIKYCVIYYTPEKQHLADFAFEEVATPRYFQWNIFNHTTLEKACFDIDGVLCVDPTKDQNDDGEKYISFLQNAAPLYMPGAKIGSIVTSRLEKYRKETEAWLKANSVSYDKLVMLDLPDMKARQKANNHAGHKAKEYQINGYNLFVESDLGQAIEINRLTKKPVFCTENFQIIFESQSVVYNLKSGKYLPFLRRVALQLRNGLRKFKSSLQEKKTEIVSDTF